MEEGMSRANPVRIASVKRMEVQVKPSSFIRNLGVLIDSTLSFGSHISWNSFFPNFIILHVFNLRLLLLMLKP